MIMKPVNPYQPVDFDPPDAVDPSRVGDYDALVYAGGGMFFDEILEYRVWVHVHGGHSTYHFGHAVTADHYGAFATYAEALEFARETPGAEQPLVLIRQIEWVAEVTDDDGSSHYERRSGNRIAEWKVEWLRQGRRRKNDIERFLADPVGEVA